VGDPRKIVFPSDFIEILDNNVVIVTGVGKSGTTVASLFICSMMPTYHIYEPVLLKLIPPETDEMIDAITRGALLYDYILPIARGMRICDYEFQIINSEWQWATCQKTRSRRRGDPTYDGGNIQFYLFHENPLFVINILNGLSRLKQWAKIFPGMHVIHIVRNGFDVIASETIRRQWHQPDSYIYSAPWSADWLVAGEKWPMPFYVEDEARECWADWTPQTRSAHFWRVQVNMYPPTIRFETLTSEPQKVLYDISNRFKRLALTELTQKWQNRLTLKKIPPHGLTLDDIQEPERKKFKETMEKLEYL
jgi:hypothetical protein